MLRWKIVLYENDQKICTSTGKNIMSVLYKFIYLVYSKGLFCGVDFQRLGYKFAKSVIEKDKR